MSVLKVTSNILLGVTVRYYLDILLIVFFEAFRRFTTLKLNENKNEMATTLTVVGTQVKPATRPANIFNEHRRQSKISASDENLTSRKSKQGLTIVKQCNRLALKRENHQYKDIFDFESEEYRGPKSPSIEPKQLEVKVLNLANPEVKTTLCDHLDLTRNSTACGKPAMDVTSSKGSIASLSPLCLADHLEQKPEELLIIDCRNFMEYNSNHISGALNVCCTNRIARKRLIDGKVTVLDLVSGPEGAKKLYQEREARNTTVVVYDDSTMDATSLTDAHSLKLLANKFLSLGKDVKFLLGGIEAFQNTYRHLCTQPDAIPQTPLLFSPTSPYVDEAIDKEAITEILPFLYLGNERDAQNNQLLSDLGVTHILNVTAHIRMNEDNGMTCKRLPASDSGSQNLKQYFDEAITFIESARSTNGRVLVHCQAGVSRSPTITIAYLMALYGKTSSDAFEFVKNKRNIVSPNLNFMGQLFEFEQRSNQGYLCPPPTSLMSG